MDAEGLLRELRSSVRECVPTGREVAIAFSGGLDSSMIAALAGEITQGRCYTCAVEGSPDAKEACTPGNSEVRTRTALILSADEVRRLTARTAQLLDSTDPIRIAYTAPIIGVLERAREGTVLAGNGADELFGGYAKYISASDPSRLMAMDLEKAVREAGELRDRSSFLDRELRFPFLRPRVMSFAENTPLADKIAGERRKTILREAARLLGLPAAERPKKAAQFSSGFLGCMEKLARSDGLELREWAAELDGNG